MGSLKRMRCEEVDMTGAAQLLAVGNAYMLQQEIEKRADGRVPEERFIDVRYHDLMRDPSGTIGRIYRRAGWDYSDEMARRVDEYIRNRPRGKHGKHAYTLESMGFDREAERERFHFYCEHYDIPEED
jgi:hypothetical protein